MSAKVGPHCSQYSPSSVALYWWGTCNIDCLSLVNYKAWLNGDNWLTNCKGQLSTSVSSPPNVMLYIVCVNDMPLHVRVCAYVCVCVCERDRVRERERDRVRQRETETDRQSETTNFVSELMDNLFYFNTALFINYQINIHFSLQMWAL